MVPLLVQDVRARVSTQDILLTKALAQTHSILYFLLINMIEHPTRDALANAETGKQLHKAIEHYLDDLDWNVGDFAEEKLGYSRTTYYRKIGRDESIQTDQADQKFLSRLASIIARGYDEQDDSRVGSDDLIRIVNVLLWAASYRTLNYDPLWPNVSTWPNIERRGAWSVGYTNVGSWIEGSSSGSQPCSEKGVVSYTKTISRSLGINSIEWVKKNTWHELIRGAENGDFDVIAPFIMKIPSRHGIEYSKSCGSTEGVSSLVGLNAISDIDIKDMLAKSEFEDTGIREIIEKVIKEFNYNIMVAYIKDDISENIARVHQSIDIEGDRIETKEFEDSRYVEGFIKKSSIEGKKSNKPYIPIITTAKATCSEIRKREIVETVKFDATEGLEYNMGKECAFAFRKGERELIDKVNRAIDIVGKIEKYQ